MTSFAFCAASLAESAALVAGMQPLTAPPIFMPAFDPASMQGHPLLFFKLHGAPGASFWYGDGGQIACSAEQLASARLNGALVFAANCWGGPESPMVQALMAAGAACVVTGEGLNYAGTTAIDGADVIGLVWRAMLELGLDAATALRIGQAAAFAHRPLLAADIASFVLVGDGHTRLSGVGLGRHHAS